MNYFYVLIYLILQKACDIKCDEKIRLTDVQTLTLYKGEMTTARRSTAIPQLKCDGGNAGCAYAPTTVQCYNRGTDGIDVQWECKGEMNSLVKFGTLKVSCEGYDFIDDPYVLAGSCGLEFTVDYVKLKADGDVSILSWIIFALIVFAFIIIAIYKSKNSSKFYSYDDVNSSSRANYLIFNTPSSPSSSPGFRIATGFSSTVHR